MMDPALYTMRSWVRINVIPDSLLDNGSNPFKGRKDKTSPIELLVADDDCGVGTWESGDAFPRLTGLSETYPGKRESLTQALDKICHLRPKAYSIWPLAGLEESAPKWSKLHERD